MADENNDKIVIEDSLNVAEDPITDVSNTDKIPEKASETVPEDYSNKRKPDEEIPKKVKKIKTKGSQYFLEEAEEGEDEEGEGENKAKPKDKKSNDDDEEDEDDDDENNYKYDEFVVKDNASDIEESVGGESDDGLNSDNDSDNDEVDKSAERKQFSRLKKRREEFTLDEEDYKLIEENQMVLEKVEDDTEDVIAPEKVIKSKRLNIPQVDEDNLSDYENFSQKIQLDDLGEFDDDNDDGEDDDNDIADSNDKSANKPKKKTRRISEYDDYANIDGPSYDQIQDARDIFGDAFDFDEFDDADEDEMVEQYDDDDKPIKLSIKEREQKIFNSLRLKFDRHQLVNNFCTSKDDEIRTIDRPERYQSVLFGRNVPDDIERSQEAEWITTFLVKKLKDQYKEKSINFDLQPSDFKSSVECILKFIQVENYEIPFIATYRKDHYRKEINRNLLWYIYTLDEKWEKIFSLKYRLHSQIDDITLSANADLNFDDLENEKIEILNEKRIILDQIQKINNEITSNKLLEENALEIIDNNQFESQEIQNLDKERLLTIQSNIENKQIELTNYKIKLNDNIENYNKLNEKINLKKFKYKYNKNVALDILELFPVDRYINISKNSYDENEIKSILKYLDIIIKGCISKNYNQNMILNNSDEIKNKIFKDKYSKYFHQIPNIREFIKLFSIKSSDFGDALRHGFKYDPPITPKLSVTSTIDTFLINNINEKIFLNAIELIISTELANEPTIRKETLEVYKQFSYISTRPTEKGKATITPFSNLFGIHYINYKPINEFLENDKTLYIRLYEAQSQGLITITINTFQNIPLSKYNSNTNNSNEHEIYINNLKLLQLFQPSNMLTDDEDESIRMTWDSLREKILINMLKKYLIPSIEIDLHRELLRIGRETIIEEAADNFSNILSYGPYRPLRTITEEERLEAKNLNKKNPPLHYEDVKDLLLSTPRLPFYGSVMAIFIANGGEKAPICYAFVDRNGVLRGHDLLPSRALTQKKSKLKQFIFDYKPKIIVINSSGGIASKSTAILIEKEIIPEVTKEIEIKKRDQHRQKQLALMSIDSRHINEDDDDLEDTGPYTAHVCVLKDEIAQIFQNSPRAKKMFPDLQPGTAAAVCLARYAQEPLAEYCNMWWSADATETFGYELLFLDLHPNKSLLRGIRQPLLQALERRLVDAVNAVGVDLNQAVSYDHMSGMLAFVSGLGLRKADALRTAIRSSVKFVESRKDLLINKLVGSVVYNNAIGFLRIRSENYDTDDTFYNVNGEDENMDEEDDDDDEYRREYGIVKRQFNPLDNTRIHPECYITYDFTLKICADALEVDINKTESEKIIKKLIQNVRNTLVKRSSKHIKWLNLWKYLERPEFGTTYTEEYHKNNEIIVKSLSTELNDSLHLLELDEYADDLIKFNKGKRRLQLEDIKEELRYPFLDLRYPLQSISSNEFFTIISNETDYSLHIGLKVGVIVQSFIDEYMNDKHIQKAVLRIDNGLRGIISVQELSDDRFEYDSINIKEKLIIGQSYQAVIINIKKDRLQIELSMKPSLLEKTEEYWYRTKYDTSKYSKYSLWWINSVFHDKKHDKYFLEDEALSEYTEYETGLNKNNNKGKSNQNKNINNDAGKTKSSGRLLRNIYHPLFANIDFKEAETRLEKDNKDGDVVIRPSSKGPNRLTITWAFQRKFYKHIDVEEKDTKSNGKSNINTIGNELYIQEPDLPEPFSDLDEIYSGYIEPMNDYVSAITKLSQDKHFHRGTPEEVEETMKQQIINELNNGIPREKQRIPWFIRFEPKKPGYFTITWMSLNVNSSQPIKKELFVVRPYGYKIKDKVFKTLDSLISYFKSSVMSSKVQQLPIPQNISMPKEQRKSRFSGPTTQVIPQFQQNYPIQQGYYPPRL